MTPLQEPCAQTQSPYNARKILLTPLIRIRGIRRTDDNTPYPRFSHSATFESDPLYQKPEKSDPFPFFSCLSIALFVKVSMAWVYMIKGNPLLFLGPFSIPKSSKVVWGYPHHNGGVYPDGSDRISLIFFFPEIFGDGFHLWTSLFGHKFGEKVNVGKAKGTNWILWSLEMENMD